MKNRSEKKQSETKADCSENVKKLVTQTHTHNHILNKNKNGIIYVFVFK